jgi:anti-sigma factor RsiW
MSCADWKNKLEAYVDSELPDSELTDLELHLRTCPSCAADSLVRLQMKRATHAAGMRYVPSPQFRKQIEQSIHARSKPFWTFSWMPKLAAVAAALALVVASAALWVRHAQREQALAEFADLHVTTLASSNPVDVISTDRHTVKPWFQGKLPFTFNLPELQNTPFTLIGGRVTYFEHSPAAQLLFEIRKHHLSVFILRDQPGVIPLNSGTTTVRQLAFNIETWSYDGLRYVVISDAGPADVRELCDLLKNAARS